MNTKAFSSHELQAAPANGNITPERLLRLIVQVGHVKHRTISTSSSFEFGNSEFVRIS